MSQVDQRNTGGRTTVVSYSAQAHFTVLGSQQSPQPIVGAGAVSRIIVIEQQQIAKERLTELSGVAQERGKEAAVLAQQGIGALAGRMGQLTLGAAVLVWIAWFLHRTAGISDGPTPAESYTFWTLLGTDFGNDYSALHPGHRHGFFAFIGLLAIVGPFAAPSIRAGWSRYLYAVPLA